MGDSYAGNGERQTGRNDEGPITNRKGGSVRGGPKAKFSVSTELKAKDLMGIPWRVAYALQADGWYLRSDVIWHKPNPMPESVTDRPTKAHEYVFLMSKSEKYFYDGEAIREDGPTYTRRASGYKSDEYIQAHPGGKQGAFSSRDVTTTGRNRRTVWTTDKPMAKLRDGLTEDQKNYVVSELLRRGLL